jgi:hypothetical protein
MRARSRRDKVHGGQANVAGGKQATEFSALAATRKLLGAFDALVVE